MIDEHAEAATIYQSTYIFHARFIHIIYTYQVDIQMTRIEFINCHRFIMSDNYFLKSVIKYFSSIYM